MKKMYLLGCLVLWFSDALSQIDSVSSPAIWLRADKSELTPTTWSDMTTLKRNAIAASAIEAPTLTGVINFNKALVFDGVDDYFKVAYSLEGLTDLSVLAVFQSADTTERGIWGTEQANSRSIFLTTRKAMGPDTALDVYGKNERLVVLNSILQNWEKSVTQSNNAFFALGSAGKSRSYKPFKGSLAELIVFDRALTFSDRIKYETYLAIKYGAGLRGPNLVSSSNQLLWRGKDNEAYAHNVAGIGRDDYFNLLQKQSGSAYDSSLLVMSIAAITPFNVENSGTLPDQNFLVWGDNGQPLAAARGIGRDSVLSIVRRKWLITSTGSAMNKKPIEIHINAAKLPAAPDGYWLVIDRSGQGNFAVDNLEYVKPDRVENGKIIYKNVLWDADGSGKDHFGLALANDLFVVVRKLSDPSCTDETAGRIRIEVIAGNGPFHNSLSGVKGEIKREWKQVPLSSEITQLKAGDYELNVSDKNNNILKRHFSLTMPDALTISLGADQELNPAKEIVLSVAHQVPDTVDVTYRWENSFGFSSTDKKITATEPGVYRVYVTKKSDGCVFTDDIAITGSDQQRVAVYPTILGTDEVFNIGISLQKPAAVGVKILDGRGIVVTEMQGTGNAEYLFNAQLPESGIYLVVVKTPSGFETRKVIVQ
ncbi:MAG TPA: T9SS type A sorting domain-containing protein [Chryseosolibacter sp.]